MSEEIFSKIDCSIGSIHYTLTTKEALRKSIPRGKREKNRKKTNRKSITQATMGIPLRVALPLLVLVVAIIMVITTFVPLYLSGEETGQEFRRVTRSEVGARIGAKTMAFFTPFPTWSLVCNPWPSLISSTQAAMKLH